MKPFYSSLTAFVIDILHLNLKSNQWFWKIDLKMTLLSRTAAVQKFYDYMILFSLDHQLQIGKRQILALMHRSNHFSLRLLISNISYSLKLCKLLVVHCSEWLPDGVEFPPVEHIFNLANYDLRGTQQYPFYMKLITSVWNFSFFFQKNSTLEFYVDKVYNFFFHFITVQCDNNIY